MGLQPVMSVKEASKLLGKEHATMTDEKVAKLIDDVVALARMALQLEKKNAS